MNDFFHKKVPASPWSAPPKSVSRDAILIAQGLIMLAKVIICRTNPVMGSTGIVEDIVIDAYERNIREAANE